MPLLFDTGGCAITETVKAMDWKRYNIKDFDEEPIAVLINLVSVHVPYTSAGKQAISLEEDVMSEIKFALMEASREVQKYISGKKKAHEIATKRKVISRYITQLSSDLAKLTGEKQEALQNQLEKMVEERYSRQEKQTTLETEEEQGTEEETEKTEQNGGKDEEEYREEA